MDGTTYTDKAVGLARLYETRESVEFYDSVAQSYDWQLSRDYVHTVNMIGTLVSERVGLWDGMEILDIGGGTGWCYTPFWVRPGLRWVNYDASHGMVAQFLGKYAGSPSRRESVIGTVEKLEEKLGDKRFDLIIACYLFSSLDSLPNLTPIVTLLKEGGHIVVADTHPNLSSDDRQLFAVEHHGKRYALCLRPVHPTDIESRFLAVGLRTVDVKEVQRSGRPYSYVYLFRRDITAAAAAQATR